MTHAFAWLAAILIAASLMGPATAQDAKNDVILLRPGALTLQKDFSAAGGLKALAREKRELAHILGENEPPAWITPPTQHYLTLADPIAELLVDSPFFGATIEFDCGDTIGYYLNGSELSVQSLQRSPGLPPLEAGVELVAGCDPGLAVTSHYLRNTGLPSLPPFEPGNGSGSSPLLTKTAPNTGVSLPTCGDDLWQAESHCGFYTVQLSDPASGTFCSGVLVSPMHVLTAGHCLCSRLNNGVLDNGVFASVGTGWLGSEAATIQVPLQLQPGQRPDFFVDQAHDVPAYCQAGLGATSPVVRADLAILHLASGAFSAAQAGFAARHVRQDELGKLRVAVGNQNDQVWGGDPFRSHFQTFGFGEGGPGQTSGVKRAALYRATGSVDCPDEGQFGAACTVVNEVYFQDDAVGLCAGDSGGGVFKFAESAPNNHAPLALMGIVSGTKGTYPFCRAPDGGPLPRQHRRNIVRVDTPVVHTWLTAVTQSAVTFVNVNDNDPQLVASLP